MKKRTFSSFTSSTPSTKKSFKSPNSSTEQKRKIDVNSIQINLDELSTSIYPECNHYKPFDTQQEPSSINSLLFSFMTDEEVQKHAVVKCSVNFNNNNVDQYTVYDPLMGPRNAKEQCKYCHEKWTTCPGHFGYIDLVHPIPHPLKIKSILQYLSLFCMQCKHLVISKDDFETIGINRYHGQKRFERILQEAEKTNMCGHCKNVCFKFSFIDDKFIMKTNKMDSGIHISQIYQLFLNITNQELIDIGLDPKYVHPKMLLLSKLPVLPPSARSYCVRGDGQIGHDDLTNKYNDIIKNNNQLAKETNEKARQQQISNLFQNVLMLMDASKVKTKNNDKVAFKSIKQRLGGKSGQVRNNIQGKRLDFCARTVITPEPMGQVDELVVPEDIASRLTIPVKVTEQNLVKCQTLLDQDKVNMILRPSADTSDVVKLHAKYHVWTEGSALLDGDIVIRNNEHICPFKYEALKKRKFVLEENDQILRDGKLLDKVKISKRLDKKLQVGDVIERKLQDGDWTLFNRQPTLWKGSMRAKKIKILPGKTFRFNLASTQAYNADFDGDEVS